MNESAIARVPWVNERWDLLDLQILLRRGLVQGTLLESGTLLLREGDTFRLAVFFVNGIDQIVNPGASRIRLTLRAANNVDNLQSLTLDPAVATMENGMPYFLFEPNVWRLGSAARDLLPDGSKELRCVADVDWTVEGKVYSSQTFPVLFEFGLTEQQDLQTLAGNRPAAEPGKPNTPGPTNPANPPSNTSNPPSNTSNPTLPPAGIDDARVRALFRELLVDALPAGNGFIYVQDGEMIAAVPAGDCTTGRVWTPT